LEAIVSKLKYPPHMYLAARRIASREDTSRMLRYGRNVNHKRRVLEEELVERHSKRRAPRARLSYAPPGKGRPPPQYVPCKVPPGPFYPKPTVGTYTPRSFRRYVAGCVREVLSKNPGAIVSMNWSTESLLRSSWSGSRSATREALSLARIYPFNPTQKDAPPRAMLTRQLRVNPEKECKTLEAFGFILSSREDVQAIDILFRRNKPLLRASLDFFAGALTKRAESTLRTALASLPSVRKHQG
jgi:hypothetical protein